MPDAIPKYLLRLFFWSALLLVGVAGAVWVAFSHYLTNTISFVLTGYDQQPLRTFEFIGNLFGLFFPNATLSHILASVIALFTEIMVLIFVHLFYTELPLVVRDYAGVRERGDRDEIRGYYVAWYRLALALALVGGLGGLLLVFEWHNFSLRRLAEISGIENPQQVARHIEVMARQMSQSGHLMAFQLVPMGAWVGVALPIAACVSLEVFGERIAQSWNLLMHAFATLPLSAGQPGDGEFAAEPVTFGREPRERMAVAGVTEEEQSAAGEPVFAPHTVAAQEEAAEAVSSTPEGNGAERHPVIGRAGERVTYEEAERDSGLLITPRGQIIDRSTYERLHGDSGPADDRPATH